MFETRITRLFDIKYPIICGGMYWIGRAELMAAVANAGGLGFMTAATFENLDDLRAEIRKTQDMTDGPIGLNINLFPALRPQPIEAWVEIACEEKIPVVETSGRSPEAIVAPLHAGGVKIMHKVPGVRYARTVERLGCDAVCVVGHECGGHPGMDEVTTLVMVPATVDAVDIPVVAAGGFADGRGLAAALALGAEAVLMGTRFMATKECPLHDNFKQAFIEAAETATVIAQKSIGDPIRVLRNETVEEVLEKEKQGATLEDLIPYIAGATARDAWAKGDVAHGMTSCGQVVGIIRDIPSVKEVVDSIIGGAQQILERLNRVHQG